jgi:hypothetical protein
MLNKSCELEVVIARPKLLELISHVVWTLSSLTSLILFAVHGFTIHSSLAEGEIASVIGLLMSNNRAYASRSMQLQPFIVCAGRLLSFQQARLRFSHCFGGSAPDHMQVKLAVCHERDTLSIEHNS